MVEAMHNVLVVGSGGREHAIACKIRDSPKVGHVFVAPGNGGTAVEKNMTNLDVKATDLDGLVAAAKDKNVALVFVGPEDPLCNGFADKCKEASIPCFGPSKAAAELEASKAYMKDFFKRHNLPTAAFANFKRAEYEKAKAYVEAEYEAGREVVVKASGLAAGKGVLMPESKQEALDAVKSIMADGEFGDAGDEVVIEQLLIGEECSCMAFADGKQSSMMVPAQDHKRALDGDKGLNTGGMGAYAPAPCLTPGLKKEVEDVLQRTVDGLAKDGRPYIGVLYGGFMFTKDGAMLLEYNCRFGDPETEVILPLLDSDLFEVALGCAEGNLAGRVKEVKWKPGAAATVVCAAKGYPGSYPKGLPITGIDKANDMVGVKVYHAGTKKTEDGHESSGGRVLTVTGMGPNFSKALRAAYAAVNRIKFKPTDGVHFRKDIGHRAIKGPTRIALVGSTRGSSSQPTIDAIKKGDLNAKVVLVVSNRKEAGILDRAKDEKLKSLYLPCEKGTDRAVYDAKLTEALKNDGVELVMFVGFMRIMSPEFCRAWAGKCINIHPSLLPKHAGGMDLEVHKAVLEADEKESGCTVHLITEEVDGGPIVVQRRVKIEEGETPESLKAKVQAEEGPALIQAVKLLRSKNFAPKGQKKELPLKRPRFRKVKTIMPEQTGVNALVKCVKSPTASDDKGFLEAVFGDDTGIITAMVRSSADLSICTPGAALKLQNAHVKMTAEGFIRVVVDKWAAVKLADEPVDFAVNEAHNVSAVEYEKR